MKSKINKLISKPSSSTAAASNKSYKTESQNSYSIANLKGGNNANKIKAKKYSTLNSQLKDSTMISSNIGSTISDKNTFNTNRYNTAYSDILEKSMKYVKETNETNNINSSNNNLNNNSNIHYERKISLNLPTFNSNYPIQREIQTINDPNNYKRKLITQKNSLNTDVNTHFTNDLSKNNSENISIIMKNNNIHSNSLFKSNSQTINFSERKYKYNRSQSFNEKDMFNFSSYHHKLNYKSNLTLYDFNYRESSYRRDDYITYKNGYFNKNSDINYLAYRELEPISIKSDYLRLNSKERVFPETASFNKPNSLSYSSLNLKSKYISNTINVDNLRGSNDTKFNLFNVGFGTNKIKGISVQQNNLNDGVYEEKCYKKINLNFGAPLKETTRLANKKLFLPKDFNPDNDRYWRTFYCKGQSNIVVGDKKFLKNTNSQLIPSDSNIQLKVKSIKQVIPNNRKAKVDIDYESYLPERDYTKKFKRLTTKRLYTPQEGNDVFNKSLINRNSSQFFNTSFNEKENLNSRFNIKNYINTKSLLTHSAILPERQKPSRSVSKSSYSSKVKDLLNNKYFKTIDDKNTKDCSGNNKSSKYSCINSNSKSNNECNLFNRFKITKPTNPII